MVYTVNRWGTLLGQSVCAWVYLLTHVVRNELSSSADDVALLMIKLQRPATPTPRMCVLFAENVVQAGQQVPPAFSGNEADSWGGPPSDTLQ